MNENGIDRIYQPTYDEVYFANMIPKQILFFENVRGFVENGKSKSYAKTNLDTSPITMEYLQTSPNEEIILDNNKITIGGLPSKQITITDIKFNITEATANTVLNIFFNGYVSLKVVDKHMFVLPIHWFSVSSNPNVCMSEYAVNMKIPIIIDPFMTFVLSLNFDNLILLKKDETCKIGVCLDGFIKRPI